MGGTTAKAGVISDGEPLTTGAALIGGYERALPIQIPMIDIFEVGTGGGSIARLGEGKALRVGPQSAGSMPGPACYGRGGTEPTVTDANLLLGRLDRRSISSAATMQLDHEAARARHARAHRRAAGPRCDRGGGRHPAHRRDRDVLRGERPSPPSAGSMPAAFTMVIYGGAGPLHASAIAREIGIRRVLIPFSPGHFSAYGMLFSDLRYDYVRSCFQRLADGRRSRRSKAIYAEMEARAARRSRNPPCGRSEVVIQRCCRHALCRPGTCGHGRARRRRSSRSRIARRSSAFRRRA